MKLWLKLGAGLLAGALCGGPVEANMVLSAAPSGAPASNTAPNITPTTGTTPPQTLTCNSVDGNWTPSSGLTFTQTFFRDGSTSISGPTAGHNTTYATAAPADQGHSITCKETGTGSGGSTTSAASNAVSVPGCTSAALSFNGTSDTASTQTLTLASANQVSFSYWLNQASFGSGDQMAFQYGTHTVAGTFYDDPNGSGGANHWEFGAQFTGAPSFTTTEYARPSAGVWHHIVAVYDATRWNSASTATPTVTFYVDGVLQTALAQTAATASAAFANAGLWVMNREGNALWNAGSMARVAIWTSALSAANVTSLHGGTSPTTVAGGAQYYWRLDTTASQPNLGSVASTNLVPSGTTLQSTGGPAVCFTAP